MSSAIPASALPLRLLASENTPPDSSWQNLGLTSFDLVGLAIATHANIARLRLKPGKPLPRIQDAYPALRRLARQLMADYRQLGLDVPFVIAIEIPPDLTAQPDAPTPERLDEWRQGDANTSLNQGEFQIQLTYGTTAKSAWLDGADFVPPGLDRALSEGGESDYQQAVKDGAAATTDEFTRWLLGEVIVGNWNEPSRIRSLIEDTAADLKPKLVSSAR
jgi:hypothetical protein